MISINTRRFLDQNFLSSEGKLNINGLILFMGQFLAHISIVPMLIWASPKDYACAGLVYFLTGCIGSSVTFHRLLSHRSWNAPVWIRRLGTLCGVYGLIGTPITWTAIHREHHFFTDVKGDPHSPYLQHPLVVQFLVMFSRPHIFYVRDLVKDPFQRFCHRHYLGIHIFIIVILSIIDPFSIIYAYLFPAAILWNMGGLINVLGHMKGYRSYKTNNQSCNNFLLGYLVWGEGWHNNHHRFPREPNFSRKWWELDISYCFIWAVQKSSSVFSKVMNTKSENRAVSLR